MLKVGLTGGIGSGKSTVSKMFANKNIKVIDCDIISREIFFLYPEVSTRIRMEFGDSFFDDNGNLKRRKLGNFVFKDAVKKKKLEDITLPCILKEIFKRADQYNKSGEKLCIVDAPTLIEVGLHKSMDLNILVWVDYRTQFIRVKNRDLLEEEEIINRIKSQLPLDEKRKYVDFVIDNSKDIKYTEQQFEEVLVKILDASRLKD